MKQALPILSLLLAGALPAQVTVGGVATTDVGAAVTAGTQSNSDSEPKDTKFTMGLGVAAMLAGASASTHASIGGSRWTPGSHSATVSNRGSLYGRDAAFKGSANTTGPGNTAGAHTISFLFSATSATKGKFYVSMSGGATKNATSVGKITIGSKSWDWKAGDPPVADSLDATLDSTGATAAVTSSGSATLSGIGGESYGGHFAVSFVPTPATYKCTITDNKDGCTNGPALAGTIVDGPFGPTATLKLTGAAKSSIGLMLLSGDGLTIKLPNGCPIFTAPIAPSAFVTSATGEATHRLSLPGRRELKFSVEDVVLEITASGIDIKSSNTLTIECKKE